MEKVVKNSYIFQQQWPSRMWSNYMYKTDNLPPLLFDLTMWHFILKILSKFTSVFFSSSLTLSKGFSYPLHLHKKSKLIDQIQVKVYKLGVPWWCSRSRIQCCHCCCSSLIPDLGMFECCGDGQKEKEKLKNFVNFSHLENVEYMAKWTWNAD